MATTAERSTALDPKHKLVYDALNGFFTKLEEEVVEIEVLPPAISPPEGTLILEDGLCVGVPKKVLAAAFIAASSIFFQKRSDPGDGSVQAALDATRVILLFDPEHLTAANFRRWRLHSFLSQSGGNLDDPQPLHLELNFLDSILTSPLHRQSKSPTLWNYRSWIMKTFHPWLCMCRGLVQRPLSESFAHELRVVLKSGERHPKNYYAWQYARRLVESTTGQHSPHKDWPLKHLPTQLCPPSGHSIMEQAIQMVHDWCLRNPSDTSAWSFLQFLLSRAQQGTQASRRIVDTTLGLALDFRWKNESLWVFLRTVIADEKLISKTDRERYVQELEEKFGGNECLSSQDGNTATETPHPVVKSLEWIRQNAAT